MKRYLLLLAPVCLAGALAWADDPALPDPERGQRLHLNIGLIEVLVDRSVKLANEEDPLRRAGHCKAIADRMGAEIRWAADCRDAPRAIELSRYLHRILDDGLALNLGRARKGIPAGSAEERQMKELQTGAAGLVADLETHLQAAAEEQAEMHKALDVLRKGKTQAGK
jgi:hypothetical protein